MVDQSINQGTPDDFDSNCNGPETTARSRCYHISHFRFARRYRYPDEDMRFEPSYEPWVLRGYLSEFIDIVGIELWQRRIAQRIEKATSSPFQSKVASDYHDDHSKPQLDAMGEAASQLPPHLPGFIALQFNEISSEELMLTHVRARCALLSKWFFREHEVGHVAAVHFSSFGSVPVAADSFFSIGLTVRNPGFRFPSDGLPFPANLAEGESPANTEGYRTFGA